MNVDHLNALLGKCREMLAMSQDVRSLVETEIGRVKDNLSKQELEILMEMVERARVEQHDAQGSIQKNYENVANAESSVEPDFDGIYKDIATLRKSYRHKKIRLDQLNEWIERSEEFVYNHARDHYGQLERGINFREKILDDIETFMNSTDISSQETFMSALSTLNDSASIRQSFNLIGIEPPTPNINRDTNAHEPVRVRLPNTPIGNTRANLLLVPSRDLEGHSMESGVSLTSACSAEDFREAKEA